MLQPVPPMTQPVIESPSVTMDRVWYRFLSALATGALTFVDPPIHNDSSGIAGQVAFDSGFIYVCVAINSWARVAIGGVW